MEVHFTPEIQRKLNDLAEQNGRGSADELVQSVVDGYFDELAQAREMLDSRDDDLNAGLVKPIDGEEFSEKLSRRQSDLLKKHGASMISLAASTTPF